LKHSCRPSTMRAVSPVRILCHDNRLPSQCGASKHGT
jgi:hypothetical protein